MWWKLGLLGVAGVVVFVVSIVAGYMVGGDNRETTSIAGNTDAEMEAETSVKYVGGGTPRPVRIEIESELETVRLAAGLDEEVLAAWWEVLGVDKQKVPLKELGGAQWYTPATAKIVLGDITPFDADERAKLYKPVSGRPQDGIVAGWATEYDASQPDLLVYKAYYWPELFPSSDPAEVTESNVNRLLFEILYEAAIGSTAITPDDYEARQNRVFGEGGRWQTLVKLEESKSQSLLHEWEWRRWRLGWSELKQKGLELADWVGEWRLVAQAQAQTCGGKWRCGALSNNCICSISGNTCVGNNTLCPYGGGTCNCVPICVPYEGPLQNCVAAYSSCGIPVGSQCSQCEETNTCGWSGPTATPRPGVATPTPPPAGSDRCQLAGRVEYFDNRNLANASSVVRFSSLDSNSYSTNSVGIFTVDKNYSNVGSSFDVYVNNPYGTYRTTVMQQQLPARLMVL